MNQSRSYAGIGARKTPDNIQLHMTNAAAQLSSLGLVLRSGGATGADTAFELGALKSLKEIYLPWDGFNGRRASERGLIVPSSMDSDKAMEMASQYHPVWEKLRPSTQQLMARNAFQVLGTNLNDPVLFVLCWTPGGRDEGGTGQAIRMAKAMDIPVLNMGKLSLQEVQTQINNIIA